MLLITMSDGGARVAGRYVVVRPLKEGHGVRTLLARDVDDAPVILKVADRASVPLAVRLRLEHEAQVLRTLDSPHIAPLRDTGVDGDVVYVVTPVVGGGDLAARLEHGPLPLGTALAVGRGVLAALATAHEQGVVHRDVKPANVVVDGEHAVLVDFGFSRSERLDAAVRDLPVGTVAYMAPEQAGLLDAEADERADLYAAGAVLFAALAGRPPFAGSALRDVLLAHLTTPPPTLASIGVTAPRAVDEIIGRLLAKDPRDRYQSAEGVLADLDVVAAAIDAGDPEPAVVVGRQDRRRTLTRPAFVGRDAELVALADAVDRARSGRGGVVLLEAESGGGKSRLLEEVAQRALRDGALVLRGQGTDLVAHRPFEVLRGVAAGVVDHATATPTFGAHLAAVVGDRRDALGAALPELRGVLDLGEDPEEEAAGPEAFGEARTVDALTAMLASLGDPGVPALVLLDDCQWADDATVAVIRSLADQLAARAAAADARADVLLVAAFRSEEVDAAHPLRRARGARDIRLGPLDRRDVGRLLESMAGPLPVEVTELVDELADGSPFMASAVLLGLVEGGGLVAEPGAWRVEPEALSAVTASRRAGAVLARRIGDLPVPVRRLLEVGAVLGKRFDLDLATALLGGAAPDAGAALHEARRRHLVFVSGTTAAFTHDKVREGVLDAIDPAVREALHRQAAEWLEAHDPGRCFELAHHWSATGDDARALPHALAAADAARAQHALAAAEQQYGIAERGLDGASPAVRLQVAEGLGDVRMLRGRYDDAAGSLALARSLCTDPTDGARVQGKLAELEFKRGDVAAARAAGEAALRTLGWRVPRSGGGFLLALLREVVVQAVHTALPRLTVGRRALEDAEDVLVGVRLLSRMAHIYWFGAGLLACGWAHLREMNLAERYPPTPELAQAYSEHAPVMTMVPWFSRGLDYADRSLRIRRELGDLWGQGQSLHFRGVVLYGASRFDEAIGSLREAVRLLQLTGDRWEVNTASWHIAFALHRQGHLADAVEEARRVHRWGVEIGDPQARGIGLAGWSKASGGRVPPELLAAEAGAGTDDVHTRAELAQAEAVRLLAADRAAEAVAELEAARRLVRDAGLRQEYVMSVLPWLATARRRQAELLPPAAVGERRRVLRAARRDARRAVRTARLYRNNLPHALREAGHVAVLSGRPARGRRHLDRALGAAEQLGMAEEAVLALRTRGTLGEAVGWPGAAEDLAAAAEQQADLRAVPAEGAAGSSGEPVTLSVLDRFDRALEAGRRIASALTADAVEAELLGAAQALLRAERCELIRLRGGRVDAEAHPGGSGAHVSDSLVGLAVERGRPVVVGGAPAEVTDSLVLSEVRSALCAPITVRGELVGALYATHRAVSSLFGEEEEQLAAFLTALAGAALENAAGVAATLELNEALEARVAERTAQLVAANEQLAEVSALKDDFLGMVAHDLRSPLTVIQGLARTLDQAWEAMDADQRRLMANRVAHNTTRLAAFVENLLEFGRLESGRFAYDVRAFPLAPLVERVREELCSSLASVQLEVDVPEDLPPVQGDEQRHWQVLTNLLANAVKFSPEGELVRLVAVARDDHVEVAVSDRGAGIAPEDLDRLFRKFSRLDPAAGVTQAAGTGLGLYICHSLVTQQGGRIWAESTPGGGSTFRYTLPLAGLAGTAGGSDAASDALAAGDVTAAV